MNAGAIDLNGIKRKIIEATVDVFSSMLSLSVENQEILEDDSMGYKKEVSGIISIVGGITGSFIFSLDSKTAIKVASAMVMEEFNEIDDEVVDAVGEITNMIVGGLKTRISIENIDFELSVPTVIQGSGHKISHFSKEEYNHFIIPFALKDELFQVEGCLKK